MDADRRTYFNNMMKKSKYETDFPEECVICGKRFRTIQERAEHEYEHDVNGKGKKKGGSTWQQHVKDTMAKNNCSFKDALKLASKTYQK